MNLNELDEILEDLNDVDYTDIVYEAYIGKTPTLLEAEKQLGKIRENLTIYNISNSDPEVLKFNRLMEKQFGMDLFALKIMPIKDIDANTLDIGLRFDLIDTNLKSLVEGDNNKGYRFVKNNGLCIVINVSYGILGNRHYSDADCMAIILHEIGHNFADCMFDKLILANNEYMKQYKQDIINGCIFKSTINMLLNKYNSKEELNREKKSQKKRSSKVIAFLTGIRNSYDYKKQTFWDALFRGINNNGALYVGNFLTNDFSDEDRENNKSSDRRYSEVVADKFPVMYGYGENITAAVYKVDNAVYKDSYRRANKFKSETLRKNNDAYEKAWFIPEVLDIEEHPHTVQRVNIALNTLESEYKKEDIDPKVKEEIAKQIKTIRKQLEYNTKVHKKYSEVEKAQALFYDYVNKSCPDAIADELEDEIEKTLDEALKNTDWDKKK